MTTEQSGQAKRNKYIKLNQKLITCVFPKGKSLPVMNVLMQQGFNRVNQTFARGFDIHDEVKGSGLPPWSEKELLTVVVDQDKADKAFELIFNEGHVGNLGGGFIYMGGLTVASEFELPELDQPVKP